MTDDFDSGSCEDYYDEFGDDATMDYDLWENEQVFRDSILEREDAEDPFEQDRFREVDTDNRF